jgi:hypothetical protein
MYDIAHHGKGIVTNERDLPRKMKPEEKCSRHHLIVQKLIESHVHVQRQGGIHGIPIELGTTRKVLVNVKVPVGLILGDMQGGKNTVGPSLGTQRTWLAYVDNATSPGTSLAIPLSSARR